jgi:hypothetical protein
MLVHECYQLERLVSDLFVLMPKKVVSILENELQVGVLNLQYALLESLVHQPDAKAQLDLRLARKSFEYFGQDVLFLLHHHEQYALGDVSEVWLVQLHLVQQKGQAGVRD